MMLAVDMIMSKVGSIIWHNSLILYICLVLDTDNTELLKKCGTGLPEKIVSKGNKLTVKFMTDYIVNAKVGQAKMCPYLLLYFEGIQSNMERGDRLGNSR